VRTLCPVDLMLVLCVHAAKHGWSQLGMLRDIATLAHFELDWEWMQAEARKTGIRRILGISLGLTHDLLGFAYPQSLKQEVEGAGKVTRRVVQNLTSATELNTQCLAYFRAIMQTRERWQDRARMGLRLAFAPSVGEWQSLRIPDALFPLYHAVRIGRLLKRTVTSGINKTPL